MRPMMELEQFYCRRKIAYNTLRISYWHSQVRNSYLERKIILLSKRNAWPLYGGMQKFQTFLYGKKFILETDHQPLQYLQKAKFQNGRLMRWALILQPYIFTVHAIKGSENVGADYLSRNFAD